MENAAGGKTEPTEREIETMLRETRAFVPISHFFWGVWSLMQVELSPVEFGFEVRIMSIIAAVLPNSSKTYVFL